MVNSQSVSPSIVSYIFQPALSLSFSFFFQFFMSSVCHIQFHQVIFGSITNFIIVSFIVLSVVSSSVYS